MLWGLKKPSHLDGSFEHPKHMLELMSNNIYTVLRWHSFRYMDHLAVNVELPESASSVKVSQK